MALEKATILIDRSRFRLGGTAVATEAQWPPAEMVEHQNDAIKVLQNVEDDNTTQFMEKKVSVTSDGSTDYTLSAAPFSLTDVRKIRSVRNDTDGERYREAPQQRIEDGVTGIWSDAKLYALTLESGAPHLKFINAPATSKTIDMYYSFYHTLITTVNIASQDIEMAESYYPILEALTALIAASKYPGESSRIQTLHTQLALIPLPGRKRPITETEAFNARFGPLVSGGHDTVSPMAGA